MTLRLATSGRASRQQRHDHPGDQRAPRRGRAARPKAANPQRVGEACHASPQTMPQREMLPGAIRYRRHIDRARRRAASSPALRSRPSGIEQPFRTARGLHRHVKDSQANSMMPRAAAMGLESALAPIQQQLMSSHPYALEWTRTTTGHTAHKALNLVHACKMLPERPDRPNSAVSRTNRTHMEERVLPRCCHGQCDNRQIRRHDLDWPVSLAG